MSGKWSSPGIPNKGWTCVCIEDLGEVDAVCEMCETKEIRYVHYMEHPRYQGQLGVGCVCAGKMENDDEGPLKRESALRNSTYRRSRWIARKWRTSQRGNPYLNTDGMNISVFRKSSGTWGARIIDRSTRREKSSRRIHLTENAAKLAAFDAMIFLKNEKGWGL